MKLKLLRGTTSKIVRLFLQDTTSSSGAGITGLTQASGGLTAYYITEGAATATAITLVAGTVGTWSSGGFKEVDAANMTGVYELGLPNAALASGNSTLVMVKGATNLVPCLVELELDAVNYQDAAALGLSRVDAAISTRLATAGYTAPDNTTIATRASQASVDAVAGYVDTEVAAIKAKTDNLPAAPAAVSDIAAQLTAQGYTVARAAKIDNADVATSTRLATGGYTAPDNASIATIAAAVDTEVAAIKAKTDNLPSSPAAVGSAMTLDLTQTVPTSNTAQTVGDALNAARAQGFGKWALSGTTLTLYAPDGTTVVRTFTLDSASAPTSRT